MVPPDCHRRNIAEVAIKTIKAHFIAILAGLPKSFPLRLWCELLSEVQLTVNILCQASMAEGWNLRFLNRWERVRFPVWFTK